jgi:hypothetical protein
MLETETKWVDWHPKVGDVRPDVYRCRLKGESAWDNRILKDSPVDAHDMRNMDYQIPAPKETTMRYWQPRIEPMAKGWTLADVPDHILCEVEFNGHVYQYRRHKDEVWRSRPDKSKERIGHCKPSKCRVIRVIDPIPPGAMTLDKVPENVNCVLNFEDVEGTLIVGRRIGDKLISGSAESWDIDRYQVLHILDPLPELSVTLDTLPVGRVIEHDDKRLFKDMEGDWTELDEIAGCPLILPLEQPPRIDKKWQVTDIIMELKEVV